VDRAAKNKAVGGLCLLDGFVHHAAKGAAVACGAAAAADAAAHRLPANMEDLGVDASGIQFLSHKRQCGIGAALFVGAAIDQQDFHKVQTLLS